jgi:hypothetical protein
MGQNTALKTTHLENYLFSKSIIENTISKREHIFELKKNKMKLGFISIYDLKDYLSNSISTDDETLQVRNIDQAEFQNVFEHPLFQRRKPQVIENINDENITSEQQYYIIQNAQKSGPFNMVQITTFIDNKELIMNDMISLNAGSSWQKLYATPGFDRRELKPGEDLPRIPETHVMKIGSSDSRNNDVITEATSSLAYLSNLKKGKIANIDLDQLDASELKKKKIIGNSYKWLFILSFIGIGYFLFSIKSVLQSPLQNSSGPILGEHTEILNPTDSSPNLNSSPRQMDKFQSRTINPVQPRPRASKQPQRSFRENNPNLMQGQHMNSDPNYYYDNSAPMELDPVREQVSKETFESSLPPGEPGPPPADDALFNQESSN